MAFTVEDGSGIAGANAYIAVATANTYHTDRGNTTWTGSDSLKQAAIVKASDYIDKRFGVKFRGQRRARDQGLEWPRINAWDNDGFEYSGIDAVPRQLQKACAEYALKALTLGDLLPDPDQDVMGAVTRKKEVVGPIEEDTTYESGSSSSGRESLSGLVSGSSIPEYPAADLMLQELLTNIYSRKIVRG